MTIKFIPDGFHTLTVEELEGYQAYKNKVKYKLLPLVW